MKLSVIIPTRNRSKLLEITLQSLLAQSLHSEFFEVIVVDNGSEDNTSKIVNSFNKSLKNLRYFLKSEPGLHVGRHLGCLKAESDILVYADDDIEAFPTWLQAIKESFDDEAVALVGGKCLPKFESDPPEWLNRMWSPNMKRERLLGYLSVIDLGDDAKFITPYHVYGCNFSIRRSVLLEAGGFHPDSMPQELSHFRGDGETYISEYVKNRGYKAFYNPLASIYHYVPTERMTNEYFCRRLYNQGISDSYTAIRNANTINRKTMTPPSYSVQILKEWFKSLSLYLKGKGALAREEAALHRNFTVAYKAGYDYHQKIVAETPELLSWVLKSDYWNSQLPTVVADVKTEHFI
jgi:glycosyltransferase involved in cell wall biosynthesis